MYLTTLLLKGRCLPTLRPYFAALRGLHTCSLLLGRLPARNLIRLFSEPSIEKRCIARRAALNPTQQHTKKGYQRHHKIQADVADHLSLQLSRDAGLIAHLNKFVVHFVGNN